ncbi:BLUF domain-containing protein [Candidatus Albibeggiatoa sp. nov. NOAA]|uniref:BLUF domain-containing protein n=1 Tax=Candidatus Albibeggiatoa sp. nov. NOAA TaxID=3162724 RepID=UPI0032F74313|nr:BLUF domain-containing protein [Thiotrichaceae bacterium]
MMSSHIYRFCYASTATEKCTSLQIGSILQSACQRNVELGITGALFFGNGYFLQFLEGGRGSINSLYHRLLRDDRHTNLQILEFKPVSGRYFEEWSMKYIHFPYVIEKILRETGLEEFDPYVLDSYAIDSMAEAFRNHFDPEITLPEPPSRRSSFFEFFSVKG